MTAPTPDPPCRCMASHAAVEAFHEGHCCFFPPAQSCHAEEYAAWKVENDRWHGAVEVTQ